MLVILLGASASAACPQATSAKDLDLALAEAEAAFAQLDGDTLATAGNQAREMLPCLDEPVTPALASRFHRVEGLRASFADDKDAAARHFASARAAQPASKLPSDLSSPVLDEQYARIDPAASPTVDLPAPQGSLTLDGGGSRARPTDRPVVVQYLSPEGGVGFTAWLRPGEAVPDYPLAEVDRLPPPPAERDRPPAAMWGAVAGAGLAAAAYGGAYAIKVGPYAELSEGYATSSTASEDLAAADRLYTINHALVIGSGVLAAGSLALGVTVFTAEW